MNRFLIIFFIVFGLETSAQTIQFPIVANAFKTAQNNSIKLRWSVGELAVKKLTGTQNTLYQGSTSNTASNVIVLAIDDKLESNPIRIYPNPVHSTLTIENVSDCKVRIIDMAGNEVHHKSKIGNTLNIEHLSPGIYIIQIQTENGSTTTHKISKN